ncbi:MAG TPA: hypothetical protein PKK06_03090 [Phycisphaerae bacterium]|nr:hypothetical protein [Phycisphaerae bacterium]HNU44670.1 hypothetical protein [Phycisphaerae bacterium]
MRHPVNVAHALVVLVLITCLAIPVHAAERSATWVGGTSNWNLAAHWSPAVVPNNTAQDVFLVTISGPPSVVTLDLTATIDTLALLNDAGLLMQTTDLTVARLHGLTNAGTLTVDDRTLTLRGLCTNNALLHVVDTGRLTFGAAAGQFAGAGTLRLAGATAQLRTVGGVAVTNGPGHTIAGYGEIQADLTNQGTIRADTAGGILKLRTYPKTNTNLIAVDADAELRVECVLTNAAGTIDCNAGTLRMAGGTLEGGTVLITDGSLVLADGGTVNADLTLAGADSVGIVTGVGNALSGNFDNDGMLTVQTGATLVGVGLYVNNGNMRVGTGAGTTTLSVLGSLGFDGIGELRLGAAGARLINGLVAQLGNHAIAGQGEIASTLVNFGTVRADVPGASLVLTGSQKENFGTLLAEAGGILDVLTTIANVGSVRADGGIVRVGATGLVASGYVDVASAGELRLQDGKVQSVGTHVAPGCTVRAVSGGAELTGSVANAGLLEVANGVELKVAGTWVNDGDIRISSTGSATACTAAADFVLDGAGTLTLTGAGAELRRLTPASVVNGFDHTIGGAGTLKSPITNYGTLLADVSGADLRLAETQVDNQGILRATGGGRLVLDGTSATGGTMSQVHLSSGAALLQNGSLITQGLVVADSSTITLNQGRLADVTADLAASTLAVSGTGNELSGVVASNGSINVANGATLGVGGMLFNTGTLQLGTGAAATQLVPLSSGITFDGQDGSVRLGGASSELTTGGAVTNRVGHALAGAGRISAPLLNRGEIVADVPGGTLELTGVAKTSTSTGELSARNGGTLRVVANVQRTSDGASDITGSGGAIVLAGVTVAADDVSLDAGSTLVAEQATLEVYDDFTFAMTDEARMTWNGGELVMLGGVSAPAGHTLLYANLEVGSADLGDTPAVAPDGGTVVANPAGFINNLALSSLTIEQAAKVNLVDAIDNGNRGGGREALYVDVLTLGGGAVLNLNGLHLYYNTLVDHGGTFEDIPVPDRMPGDFDDDCNIDVDDYAALPACLTGPGVPIDDDCTVFDLDFDGDVDLRDMAAFQRAFTGPAGQIPGCE